MKFAYFLIWLLFFSLPGMSSLLYGQSIYKIKQITTRASDDIVTGFSKNGVIFSSNRPLTTYLQYTDAEKRNTFNMYELPVDSNGVSGSPHLFAEELTTLQNDGPASLDSTGNLIVFTRNFTLKNFGNIRRLNPNYGLFFAEKINGKWTNIREFEHNSPMYRTTHPSLSADGRTLFFSCDKEGGFGGFDIYVSSFQDNRWSEPRNLGPKVNTNVNDVYPYLHSSGRLYFSSEGHVKQGGYDIYYTEPYRDDWIEPVRLSAPFNSSSDDFTILLDDNFETGFITSARRGALDIYMVQFTLPAFDVCKLQKRDNFCFVFYEENTMEIDTTLYRYVWDLGDGTKIEAVEAEHCYADPGKYIISLDVVDVLTKEVMFNQAEHELELKKTIQPFITCPDTVYANQEFQLNGYQSFLGGVEPAEYYWDFGNGIKAVGASVKNKYLIPGVFIVKLGIAEEAQRNKVFGKHCSYKSVVVIE